MAVLRGMAFLDWLLKAGVIPAETRRVVIDASVDTPVVIYIEKYGTPQLISVAPPPELGTAVKIVSETINEGEMNTDEFRRQGARAIKDTFLKYYPDLPVSYGVLAEAMAKVVALLDNEDA